MSEIELYVPPAYIPLDGQYRNLSLMEHQQATLSCEKKLVILDAPTSSGKTLAMLARLMECEGDALFLYPTNELINDQARSLETLLKKMKVSCAVVPVESDGERSIAPDGNVEVVIAVATGESLEGIARTKGEALRRLQKIDTKMVLLSNIDVLTLILKQRYHGSYILPEFLRNRWALLAVDELHMYSGVMLANLLYLMWLLRDVFPQFVVSSATHHDALGLLRQMFESHTTIHPTVLSQGESNARQIRHPCELTIMSLPTRVDDAVRRVYEEVMKLHVPNEEVLAIVDSVASSELLSDMLEEAGLDVGRISGFVPTSMRRRGGDVTVGTRAVEVGVDFDVNRLVFEARDAHTFVQRLGRAARYHDGDEPRKGVALAFVHQDAIRLLREGLGTTHEQDIQSLSECVLCCMPKLGTYSTLASSKYGVLLMAGLLYPVVCEGTRSTIEWINKLREMLYSQRPPFLPEEVVRNAELRPKVIRTIAEGGARGDILSVPAFIERYGTYMRVDVLELARAEFHFERVREGAPPWVGEDEVAHISAWRVRPPLKGNFWRLKGDVDYQQYIKADGCNDNIALYIDGADTDELMSRIKQLLHGKLAYPTYRKPDWRLTSIYCPKPRCHLVLGLDALVQQHVERDA